VSTLLGQPSGGLGVAILQQSDGRVMQRDFQWDYTGSGTHLKPWADGMLWPRARFGGNDGTSMPFGCDLHRFENDQQDVLGGSQVKKIIGTTKDSSGSNLGNCIVQGFLTSTDVCVGQTTSDTGGYYELPTSYAGVAHYLVAYKAGSPDVAGTSVNTLVPV
jgi:hypothetical protein